MNDTQVQVIPTTGDAPLLTLTAATLIGPEYFHLHMTAQERATRRIQAVDGAIALWVEVMGRITAGTLFVGEP